MTAIQQQLSEAIESRGSAFRCYWQKDELIAEYYPKGKVKPLGVISLIFDVPAECYGVQISTVQRGVGAVMLQPIAMYEALRIGNPEALPEWIASCAADEEDDGSPEVVAA